MDECMKTFFTAIDSIVEDPKKTKAIIKWMRERGMLDETAIAMYEIDQANKESVKCNHCYPDGSSAMVTSVEMDVCRVCGADDYPVPEG